MKSVDTIARVRRAFYVQGWPLKRISRDLHVSRNTVRRILRSNETSFSYEREHQPKPKIGPWQVQLDGGPPKFKMSSFIFVKVAIRRDPNTCRWIAYRDRIAGGK